MRSIRSFLIVSFVSTALAGLAAGCAMDPAAEAEDVDSEAGIDVGTPDEAIDVTGAAQESTDEAEAPAETPATGKPYHTSSARENGDWCHAVCNNDRTYAGPNVTENCTGWGEMVCQHRGTTLFQAFWCRFGDCWVDVVLW